MALVHGIRIRVSTSTTGTGTFSLGAATSSAFQDFETAGAGGIPTGSLVDYSAFTTTQWECGTGTYTTGAPHGTLARTTIDDSSNAGAVVNFSVAPTVVCTLLPKRVDLGEMMQSAAVGIPTISVDYFPYYDSVNDEEKRVLIEDVIPQELLIPANEDKVWYVRKDGLDSNTGLADNGTPPGGAFLTIQKAVDVAETYDYQGLWFPTINVRYTGAPTTYDEGVAVTFGELHDMVAFGQGFLQGYTANPERVTISTTGDTLLGLQSGWHVRGFTLTSTTFGSCVNYSDQCYVSYCTMGDCADHVFSGGGTINWYSTTLRIETTGATGLIRSFGGEVFMEGIAITIVNPWTIPTTPSFHGFITITAGDVLIDFDTTITGGANVTGRKYNITGGNYSGWDNYTNPDDLPGTTAGVLSYGAQINGRPVIYEKAGPIDSSDIAERTWLIAEDTSGNVPGIYYNDAGIIKYAEFTTTGGSGGGGRTLLTEGATFWVRGDPYVSTIANGTPGVITTTVPHAFSVGDGVAVSLDTGQVNCTLTLANPCVVTAVGNNFANGDIVTLRTTGALPTSLPTHIINSTPTIRNFCPRSYYVINKSGNTFQLSLTSGGAAISTAALSQSGSHIVRRTRYKELGTCTFDTTLNRITCSATHGLVVGDEVAFATTGSLVTGLSALGGAGEGYRTYYVKTAVSTTVIEVCAGLPTNSTAIVDLTGSATGTAYLFKASPLPSTGVTGPLEEGKAYYVNTTPLTTTLTLAASPADVGVTPINFTGTNNGRFWTSLGDDTTSIGEESNPFMTIGRCLDYITQELDTQGFLCEIFVKSGTIYSSGSIWSYTGSAIPGAVSEMNIALVSNSGGTSVYLKTAPQTGDTFDIGDYRGSLSISGFEVHNPSSSIIAVSGENQTISLDSITCNGPSINDPLFDIQNQASVVLDACDILYGAGYLDVVDNSALITNNRSSIQLTGAWRLFNDPYSISGFIKCTGPYYYLNNDATFTATGYTNTAGSSSYEGVVDGASTLPGTAMVFAGLGGLDQTGLVLHYENVNIKVLDEAYGAGWNASTSVPTKNAVYDKIETLGAGAGNVSNSGTPVDNQLAVWTGTTTIEGDANLTFDTATDILSIGGTGDVRVNTAGANAASVVLVGGTQTLTSKTLTSPTIGGTPTASGATWASLGIATTIDINGGTLDGVVIGGAAAAAATVTTLVSQTHTPAADGTYDLGSTSAAWNNLYLDTGATINVEAGNWIATHTSGVMNISTGALQVGGSAVETASGSANSKIASIGITIDGGGSAITTGVKGYIEVPYACTINRCTMLADVSGSIVVDIWKDTYAAYPPVNADSITASANPTISSNVKSQDTTLTGWTTSIAAGDILAFNVDSATTITRLNLILKVTKT